jgi:hypothetical protein
MSQPSEDIMRTQMHNTMIALERMANAVAEHLTADRRPCEQNEPADTQKCSICFGTNPCTKPIIKTPCRNPASPYDQMQTEGSDPCVNCGAPLRDHRRTKVIDCDLIVKGDLTVEGCATQSQQIL